MKCKSLMIQGTGSSVGKSLITAALCRILNDRGIDVVPFKAQNMSLNSSVTFDNGEIGRAQALQAQAARVRPETAMNPVLLKPAGEAGIQVIIQGKVYGTLSAQGYYNIKRRAVDAVHSSYDALSKRHELIILEGAGSPAEINLMKDDVVNMSMARYANAPVLLAGDIDKGGVFASFYGTVKLLGRDSRRIKALIINKFRGDLNLLKPGLAMIQEKTGKPVIGVLPYVQDIGLPEEDGLVDSGRGNPCGCPISGATSDNQRAGARRGNPGGCPAPTVGIIKVIVLQLNYISNFTDFDPFFYEPDVRLVYSRNPSDIEQADIVMLPGTKNTMDDLAFLRKTGLAGSILHAYRKGIQIIGICGGYQMLGKRLLNPYGVEGPIKKAQGLGVLDIETVFQKNKSVSQVEAEVTGSSAFAAGNADAGILHGYEIHHGISSGARGLFKLRRMHQGPAHENRQAEPLEDGSVNRNCWGTYMHGIFENDRFRRNLLNQIRIKKGLRPLAVSAEYAAIQDKAIDHFAGIVRRNLDLEFIMRIAGV